jgi:biopolymer transport protein TolR
MPQLDRRTGTSLSEINIVPFVDVMLVLLVIFMVTAPLIQTASIELPSVGKASQPPAQPLEVTIRADGTLTLRDRARGADEETLAKNELARRIRGAQQRNPAPPVVIAADKTVRYELVMNVMDELQKQQVARIGLLVQPGK